MLRLLKYLLNLPYSVVALVHLVFCIPYGIQLRVDAVVFRTFSCGLIHLFAPKARGFASGNIVVVKKGELENIVQHELVHIEQYMKYPLIFGFMYMYELLRKGYWNNKYEIEAYNRTDTWPQSKQMKTAT